MSLITNTKDLIKACKKLSKAKFITVDTEFIREKNYWAKLCLIQVASLKEEFIIDPLAEDINLDAFYELMANKKVLKVFHACRQDMEIFFIEMKGKLPTPIFDAQIAAMVCGYGEQVSYEHLVNSIVKKNLDKSSRFTDWAQRPLTPKQLEYAISDVTHLRDIYLKLSEDLEAKKRKSWIKDEMQVLTNKEIYNPDPQESWKKIKINTNNRRTLGVLQELAAWREITAQKMDVPKSRILRDEALSNIALNPPKTQKDFASMRGLPGGLADNSMGKEIMEAIKRGQAQKNKELPERKKSEAMPGGIAPSVELLKVLLKMKSEDSGVAHRMIANNADLEQLAAYKDKAEIAAMSGWRLKLFGADALKLLNGKLALSLEDHKVKIIKS